MIQLVLGGARSGKSSYAESQVKNLSEKVTYIASASADDSEMQQRIAHHQSTRPSHWCLVEEKLYLSQALEKIISASEQEEKQSNSVVLIDCLTLWLSNWLCRIDSGESSIDEWQLEKSNFILQLQQVQQLSIPIVLVSNEVGSGIVPMGELTRQFVDQAGWLNQAIAKVADQVMLVVAGLPLALKSSAFTRSSQIGDSQC